MKIKEDLACEASLGGTAEAESAQTGTFDRSEMRELASTPPANDTLGTPLASCGRERAVAEARVDPPFEDIEEHPLDLARPPLGAWVLVGQRLRLWRLWPWGDN